MDKKEVVELAQKMLAYHVIQYRKANKQTLAEFASGCGISVYLLQSIESRQANPTLATLNKLAEYMGCEVSNLLQQEQ